MFYLAMMIVIGAVYMKKTSSSEDYFLGGRGLNGWVAALSAQASDMSGWLLMGLPGAIYSLGSGQIWIAVGLFIGTVLNWVCISGRLRKYTIVANNSMTIPAFFENRYRDKKKILLLISSIVIVVFFLVYTASALAAGGKLFNTVFGLDYHVTPLCVIRSVRLPGSRKYATNGTTRRPISIRVPCTKSVTHTAINPPIKV